MNKENIKQFFLRYKRRLCATAVIIVILVIAFCMDEEPVHKPAPHSFGNTVNMESRSDGKAEQQSVVESCEEYTDSSVAAVQNDTTAYQNNEDISDGDIRQESDTSEVISNQEPDTSEVISNQEPDMSEMVSNQIDQTTAAFDKGNTVIEESRPQETTTEEATTQKVTLKEEELSCTFSISCSTILDNMDKLDKDKKDLVPSDGWILKPVKVEYKEGESVFDVLQKVCQDKKIHMEASWTPIYNSAYIEGINNLYQFDCGSKSGWMYCINGVSYNYGSSQAVINNGDNIAWVYTCDLGKDVQK